MWEYNYNYSTELYHYGVKGMRWGHRRYRNEDGSLNRKGIKKYAKAGYAKDSRNSNASASRSVHKAYSKALYKTSSKNQNEARAERYLADRKTEGRKKVAKSMAIVGGIAAADLAITRGKGLKIAGKAAGDMVKLGAKYTGRAVVSAYMMSKGHTNIRWED